ncbi:aldo/keto reductase [Rubrolithibacter danxiaensis]|uniref:aldo/keto reductase n=1 Tax=Rubrolithibacter danxiaensis TaxID=3390805 RepID=UPI003BF830D8
MMELRKIGKSALEVYPLCFGGNVFGWTADEKKSFELLDAFTDAGLNFIDTANSYSRWVPGNQGGESETIIGKWFKSSGKRQKIILATKVGSDMGNGEKGLSKNYIIKAAEQSLTRLQTDYIDLYQSHYDDPETPIEETLEAYNQLIREGKVRIIGASNFTAQRLKESLEKSEKSGLPRYECLQPEYNLYEREQYEKEYEQLVLENKIGVITYYSLASGFLTGKYHSETDFNKSARGGGMKKYMNERGFRIIKALEKVAQQYNTSAAAVALAWLMACAGITAPIASATSTEQLKTLVQATELRLDEISIRLLDEASAYT